MAVASSWLGFGTNERRDRAMWNRSCILQLISGNCVKSTNDREATRNRICGARNSQNLNSWLGFLQDASVCRQPTNAAIVLLRVQRLHGAVGSILFNRS